MPLSKHNIINGKIRKIETSDHHILEAWEVHPPKGTPLKGNIVVIQEIFGLTDYIRRICAAFAEEGYHVLSPALYDRVKAQSILPYNEKGVKDGLALRAKIPEHGAARDVEACVQTLKNDNHLKVGVIGFCWGGFLAWEAAQSLNIDAASCWYGPDIAEHCDPAPHCPTELHFGEKDAHIPSQEWDKISVLCPQIPIHIYKDADHGFGCTERDSFHKESFLLAWQRTLDLFAKYVD